MNNQKTDYTRIASTALIIAMIALIAVVLFKVPEKIEREKRQDNLINSLASTDRNVEDLTQRIYIMEKEINGLAKDYKGIEKVTFEVVQRVDNIVVKTYEPTARCIYGVNDSNDSFLMSCVKLKK